MTPSERGSATVHTLLAAVLLFTALAAAILWSTISTARHKLTAAADLTALSAAQSLTMLSATDSAPATDDTHATATSLNRQRLPTANPRNADQPSTTTAPATPCETAARIATLNNVHLTNCAVTADSATIEVSLELDLPFGHRTLSATARAGPL